MDSFCGLDKWITKNIKCLKYLKPTKIQEAVIPHILNNKGHLIGVGRTGTGKTASFCLPLLHELSMDPSGVFAIILEPTRELALQVIEKLKVFTVGFNLRVSMIIGGDDYITQLIDLDRIPHIIVATPGRLMDLLQNDKIPLIENLKYLVLDEFDQLFNDTISPTIRKISQLVKNSSNNSDSDKKEIVNLLFTATYTGSPSLDTIKEVLCIEQDKGATNETEDINIISNINNGNNKASSSNITIYDYSEEEVRTQEGSRTEEKYLTVPTLLKETYLAYLLKSACDPKKSSSMIFVQTCFNCQSLSEILRIVGFNVSSVHSKLSQKQRFSELKKFKNSESKILVTTDLSCRGLDIHLVDYVINYDLPRNPVDYIHRIGRCGRAFDKGAGLSISFVTPIDVEMLLGIEKHTGKKLEELEFDEESAMKELTVISRSKKMVKVKMNNDKKIQKNKGVEVRHRK